jgi:hypothetical protein
VSKDDIRGAQGPVDVLVRRAHRVRPHLPRSGEVCGCVVGNNSNGGVREASAYLDGAHGGVESGEAAVEGAEGGDDGIGDLLALVEGLAQQRGALREGLHLSPRWFGPPPVELMLTTCGGRGEGRGAGWIWGSCASGDFWLSKRQGGWRRTPPSRRLLGRRAGGCLVAERRSQAKAK